MSDPTPYDSTADTQAHIARVQELLHHMTLALIERGRVHDASKLLDPEKPAFDRVTPLLKTLTYGTPEYQAGLVELGAALDHHYRKNSHHPQHHAIPTGVAIDEARADLTILEELTARGTRPTEDEQEVIARAHARLWRDLAVQESRVNNMSLLDIVEMFVDWKAASERHADGDIRASIAENRNRFVLSDQLAAIFENTVREMGW